MEGQEKKPQENISLDEARIENIFNANLLTNYEATLIFMKVIEGPGWLENQPKGINIKNTLEHVMDWFINPENSESHCDKVILYGWGGGDRYIVSRDGSVEFIASFGVDKTINTARGIGFPFEKKL